MTSVETICGTILIAIMFITLFVVMPVAIILAIKHKPCKHDWERIAQLHKQVESNYRPRVFLDHGAVIVYRCKNCGKFKKVDLSK